MQPFFWTSSFLFPPLFVIVGVLGLFLPFTEWSYSLSVFIVESSFDSLFVIDLISLSFFFVVGVVSTSVLIYTVDYMKDSTMKLKFVFTMIMFISSMFILSMSANLFWVMVGWDGLGLTSLVLIMFFQNWKSFNSAMVTFLSNRLGDATILISLIWIMSVGSASSVTVNFHVLFSLCLIIGAFSKSAQVPFSAWLPLAMAAPTPVSSLVHSSTLVTAGVYLLVRFKNFLMGMEWVIFLFSSITILLAASSSMGEYDLKKIIALSTLSHVGLMMMFIGLSSFFSVLVHLHAHAMFKSLLFMIAGDLIHNKNNTQDIRSLSISVVDFPTGVSLVISLVSMMGIPFFSGFYSKELFLCLSAKQSIIEPIVFMVAASLTASYSIRILFSLISNPNMVSMTVPASPNWKVFFSMSLFSVMSGGIFYSFLMGVGVEFFPMFPAFFSFKKEVFLFLLGGLLLGVLISLLQGAVKLSGLISWIHAMWWVSSVCFFFQKGLFSLSWEGFFKYDSKGILDFLFQSKKWSMKSLSNQTLSLMLSFPLFSVGMSVIMISFMSFFIM